MLARGVFTSRSLSIILIVLFFFFFFLRVLYSSTRWRPRRGQGRLAALAAASCFVSLRCPNVLRIFTSPRSSFSASHGPTEHLLLFTCIHFLTDPNPPMSLPPPSRPRPRPQRSRLPTPPSTSSDLRRQHGDAFVRNVPSSRSGALALVQARAHSTPDSCAGPE